MKEKKMCCCYEKEKFVVVGGKGVRKREGLKGKGYLSICLEKR